MAEREQFAKEEKTIRREASYQEGKRKKDVPFGSRKNPLYVRGERQRDVQADADFKKLELIRETKEAKKDEEKDEEKEEEEKEEEEEGENW